MAHMNSAAANSVVDASEEKYAVEKICDRRLRRGKDCENLIQQNEAARKKVERSTATRKTDGALNMEPSTIGREGEVARRELENKGAVETSASKKKRRDSESETDNDSTSGISLRTSRVLERTEFDSGLEAEEILATTDSSGRHAFFIKFKGVDEPEMVPASVANEQIPQMVIKYYEGRLFWKEE